MAAGPTQLPPARTLRGWLGLGATAKGRALVVVATASGGCGMAVRVTLTSNAEPMAAPVAGLVAGADPRLPQPTNINPTAK